MTPTTEHTPTDQERPIVVVSALPGHIEPTVELLAEAGCEVRRLPGHASFTWTESSIEEHLREADGLVGLFAKAPITQTVLLGAPRLRVVTSPIIGTETIDVEACSELGIVVGFGATEENVVGMAEAIVMLAAALRKQLPDKMAAVADGSWRPSTGPGHLLRDSVVGLVGFGAIGRTTAERLAGWGCRLLVNDPYLSPGSTSEAIELVGLDELLESSDVISLTVPLTDETRNLIGAPELARMKPGASLINTSRGGIVDEAALLDALDRGRLAGAAIDTWVEEGVATPGADYPLRHHPKVIATGHSVGHSIEVYDSHPPAACDNTLRALRGVVPLHVRNPEVLPSWRERVTRLDRQRRLRPLQNPR